MNNVNSKYLKRWHQLSQDVSTLVDSTRAEAQEPVLVHLLLSSGNRLVELDAIQPDVSWHDSNLSCDHFIAGDTLVLRATWYYGQMVWERGEHESSILFVGHIPVVRWQGATSPDELENKLREALES